MSTEIMFSIKKDIKTRGHEVALVKDQCRLDVRKYSFSQRTINEWNRLPADCVGANKIDKYLRRVQTPRYQHLWTPDKPTASSSTCQLELKLSWQTSYYAQ